MLSLTLTMLTSATIHCVDMLSFTNPESSFSRFDEWPKVICSQLSESYEDISITKISASRDVSLTSEESGRMGTYFIGDLKAGRIRFQWSSLESDSKKVVIWLKVDAKKDVWVFRKNLKVHEKIKSSSVKRKVVDVASIVGIKTLLKESPVGSVVKKRVGKGRIVTEDIVNNPPIIKKNDRVNILVKQGSLMITVKGIAESTGWSLGEEISVRTMKKRLKAIVTGEKQVNVEI